MMQVSKGLLPEQLYFGHLPLQVWQKYEKPGSRFNVGKWMSASRDAGGQETSASCCT